MTEPNLVACKCGGLMLDIGCGTHLFSKLAHGIDRVDFGQKYIADIDDIKTPWPILDNMYDSVHAYNILEHIWNKLHVLNEMWRVLKPRGIVEIVVPDAGNGKLDLSLADPTHITLWVKGTFTTYLCGHRPGGTQYNMRKWELIECRNMTEINDNIIFCRMRKPL